MTRKKTSERLASHICSNPTVVLVFVSAVCSRDLKSVVEQRILENNRPDLHGRCLVRTVTRKTPPHETSGTSRSFQQSCEVMKLCYRLWNCAIVEDISLLSSGELSHYIMFYKTCAIDMLYVSYSKQQNCLSSTITLLKLALANRPLIISFIENNRPHHNDNFSENDHKMFLIPYHNF